VVLARSRASGGVGGFRQKQTGKQDFIHVPADRHIGVGLSSMISPLNRAFSIFSHGATGLIAACGPNLDGESKARQGASLPHGGISANEQIMYD